MHHFKIGRGLDRFDRQPGHKGSFRLRECRSRRAAILSSERRSGRPSFDDRPPPHKAQFAGVSSSLACRCPSCVLEVERAFAKGRLARNRYICNIDNTFTRQDRHA